MYAYGHAMQTPQACVAKTKGAPVAQKFLGSFSPSAISAPGLLPQHLITTTAGSRQWHG